MSEIFWMVYAYGKGALAFKLTTYGSAQLAGVEHVSDLRKLTMPCFKVIQLSN